MEKKISAVEWLIYEHFGGIENCTPYFRKHIEQAKQMEKKQREKSFVEGYKARALASNLIFDEKSEYYAKTLFQRIFKSK